MKTLSTQTINQIKSAVKTKKQLTNLHMYKTSKNTTLSIKGNKLDEPFLLELNSEKHSDLYDKLNQPFQDIEHSLSYPQHLSKYRIDIRNTSVTITYHFEVPRDLHTEIYDIVNTTYNLSKDQIHYVEVSMEPINSVSPNLTQVFISTSNGQGRDKYNQFEPGRTTLIHTCKNYFSCLLQHIHKDQSKLSEFRLKLYPKSQNDGNFVSVRLRNESLDEHIFY